MDKLEWGVQGAEPWKTKVFSKYVEIGNLYLKN